MAALLCGCGKVDRAEAPPAVDATEANDSFLQAHLKDKDKPSGKGNGVLEGQILWQGEPPRGDKSWLAPLSPLIERRKTPVETRSNPYFPRIGTQADTPTGLADVVVALVNGPVRPEAAWPHGELKAVLRNHRLVLQQDKGDFSIGFIRPDETIALELESGDFDTIRGRGAAFFAAPLIKPGDTSKRPLRRPGIVKLSSSAGHFWVQGLIIASPTPLIARSGADGKFRIAEIPPGDWTLLCFRPSQVESARERDGETLETYLLDFAEPVVGTFAVQVGPMNVPLRIAANDQGFTRIK